MPVDAKAANIKLLVLDCDGVLTDGGLFYTPDGQVIKRFNVSDGLGIKMAQACGLPVAVITGLNHPGVEARVRELGIEDYYPGRHDKAPLLQELCDKYDITTNEIAYMGDDWIDVKIMRMVGLAMAPPNAEPEVLEIADWIAPRAGGHGAVRDAIKLILKARGLLECQWKLWNGEPEDGGPAFGNSGSSGSSIQ